MKMSHWKFATSFSISLLLVFGGMLSYQFSMNERNIHKTDSTVILSSSDNPVLVSNARMVYDSESDIIVCYGGFDGSDQYRHETWVYDWNQNSWENMTAGLNPGPRADPMMVYDSNSDRVLLYGGIATKTPETIYMSDLWEYDFNSNTWTNVTTKVGPGKLQGAGMVFDKESNMVIMFGGMHTPILTGEGHSDETWAYNVSSNVWTNMGPAEHPSKRHHVGMTYDVDSDRVVLFGGFDPGAWNNVSAESWTYDVNSNVWTQVSATVAPEARFYGEMAYDIHSDRTILFGGASSTLWDQLGDTWSYGLDSNVWTNMGPAQHPSNRQAFAVAYDSESDRMVLWGGISATSWEEYEFREDHTWAYNLDSNVWSNMAESDGNNTTPSLTPIPGVVIFIGGTIGIVLVAVILVRLKR
ncbi:MAG: Kelch repeat-containing protein [Candidatus Thorarchaeota archaeon]|jgi:hypothetical protein